MFGIGYARALASGQSNAKQPTDRDKELENIVGNLLISKFQVDRLETRLSDKLYRDEMKSSTFMFKKGGDWHKVSILVQREEEEKKEPEKDPNPNNDRVNSVYVGVPDHETVEYDTPDEPTVSAPGSGLGLMIVDPDVPASGIMAMPLFLAGNTSGAPPVTIVPRGTNIALVSGEYNIHP